MADNTSIIELYILDGQDITEANTIQTTIQQSTSEVPLVQQEHYTNTETTGTNDIETISDNDSSNIQVTVYPRLKLTMLWAKDVSKQIRIKSLLQINGDEEVYEVTGIMRRSARFDTLICMGNKGNTIGLVVNAKDFKSPWTIRFYRHFILTPRNFI